MYVKSAINAYILKQNLGHATTLKLLGRACRPFAFHNAREISLCSCTRRIPDLHNKKKRNN